MYDYESASSLGYPRQIVADWANPSIGQLAYDFAALLFKGPSGEEMLKEEFPMLNTLPILRESWRVQEVMEWGREEVREEAEKVREEAEKALQQAHEEAEKAREEAARAAVQAQQQAAIKVVARRFPQLEPLAQVLITAVSDVMRLQTLIVELSVVPNKQCAREVLEALVLDVPKDEMQPSAEIPRDERKGNWGRFFSKILFWRHRPKALESVAA